mmetsp:Transcript_66586/g.117739  ORF Transcript_66586/g.117739 Transcript_66586/m.117739 type:complete len:124 (-) Transcript_66586:263-634(-)|eukprot:CAMPEP_0197638094 /NCGR_PEP_ID=MMETSP1338-20131121/13116_1 /TAXON_ID=43686 ORGANISM="Pelagodinium beii, Strain RCC1491" /NCGR_SAMPLE_ID=MMETSP1338 /ASSEMBLY_ACC=CAM_ASM_000754 /LENGTH=123 /DNA_ID=CAMNT_0043210613 /DNA_START=206 /DNA_END=577 /DNA_ORIENTATION=-
MVRALLKENYGVQLKHDSVETSWSEHGYVKVKDSDGKVMAEHKDFQHNKRFRQAQANAVAMVAQIKAALEEEGEEAEAGQKKEDGKKEPEPGQHKGYEKSFPEAAPSESEASTGVPECAPEGC